MRGQRPFLHGLIARFLICCGLNKNFAMHVTWSLLISLCDSLVSHPNCVHPITTTRLLPPPGHFEPNRLPHTPTTSFQVRPLVIHLHCVFLSAITCFAPPSPQIEPKHSSPTSTVSIQAQPLVIHLQHVYSSPNAHFPPPPCPFELKRSSPATVSIQA